MRKIKFLNCFYITILCIVPFLSFSASTCHAEVQSTGAKKGFIDYEFADSSVLDVSSGPRHDILGKPSIHYRIVTVLVEVSVIVYYQQIQYGEENCCLKINFTREISGDDLEGHLELFNVKDISWLTYDTVQFMGNSARYTIKLSEETYAVKRK